MHLCFTPQQSDCTTALSLSLNNIINARNIHRFLASSFKYRDFSGFSESFNHNVYSTFSNSTIKLFSRIIILIIFKLFVFFFFHRVGNSSTSLNLKDLNVCGMFFILSRVTYLFLINLISRERLCPVFLKWIYLIIYLSSTQVFQLTVIHSFFKTYFWHQIQHESIFFF